MDKGQKYFGENDIRPSFLTAKELEENPDKVSSTNEPSLYVHSNKKPSTKSSNKPSRKSKLKLAPFGLGLIGILAVVVFLALGSNSFLGPHLESLFTEATSTDYTAYSIRSNEVILEILQGKLEMPNYFKERLTANNINVVNDTTLEFNGQTITADNYLSLYNSDVYFREAVTYARRGRIAMFFDSAAEEFYNKLGLSRDVFHDDVSTGNNEEEAAYYNDKMTSYFSTSPDINVDTAEEISTEDEDGNIKTEYISTGEIVPVNSTEGESAETKAKAYLDSIGEKVTANTPGCAALEIGNIIATAVSANNNYTAIHEYMTKMEPISKSRYINNDGAAINSVLNWFTKTATTTVYDAETGEKIEVTGSPLESEGMRVVLGGLTADSSNTKKYSLERAFKSTDISISNSGLATNLCKVEKAAGAVISLAALATPGSSLIRASVGILLHYTVGAGIQIIASSVLGLLVPTIAEVMFENPFENAVGIAGGESFAMGAANINQLSAQQNSGASAASRAQVLAYNHVNNQIIAQAAEIDRKNYSPFDPSNKNTFFGSITASLLPLATTSATFSTPITTLASTVNTSIASLNPAYADGENTSLLTSFGNYCSKLDEIDAAGNLYCKSTATHDLSTLDLSTEDPTYKEVLSESIEYVDGKEAIIPNSPLADYITFWMGRYSMPGIKDANIAYACEHRSSYIPFLSDIADMVRPTSDYCETVADGSRYVNSESNPNWEIEKYHQLYVLTNRVKTNLGFYEEEDNPVAIYQHNYELEHPLDNSRSGYLARISGLSKDDAEGVIALADYYQKLEDYDASLAYIFSTTTDYPDTMTSINETASPLYEIVSTNEAIQRPSYCKKEEPCAVA